MVILTVCVCVWSVLVVPAWAEVVFILVILTVIEYYSDSHVTLLLV